MRWLGALVLGLAILGGCTNNATVSDGALPGPDAGTESQAAIAAPVPKEVVAAPVVAVPAPVVAPVTTQAAEPGAPLAPLDSGDAKAAEVKATPTLPVGAKPSGALAKATRTITLRTDPPDAKVYIDGAVVGRTPLKYEVTEGTPKKMRFMLDGYKTEHRTVSFEKSRDLVNVILKGQGLEIKTDDDELSATPIRDPYR